MGVAGEILITLGLLILLFVGWQLWWTDVLAHRAYVETRALLNQEWGIYDTVGREPRPVEATYGKAFALMYIPGMRDSAWGVPGNQGTDLSFLQNGVGHHEDSAMPGELGNFAVAGHRTTYGAPFGNIDQLAKGDQVIVETKHGWYIYELDRSEIIDGWEGWVLDPVPGKPRNTVPTEALITIYACHPKFSAAQRYVWFGHLVDEYSRSSGTPPAIEAYGKDGKRDGQNAAPAKTASADATVAASTEEPTAPAGLLVGGGVVFLSLAGGGAALLLLRHRRREG